MPRKADDGWNGRIVAVAYRRWSDKGEKAMTMRAVAKMRAPPRHTLYERFATSTSTAIFCAKRRAATVAAIQPAKLRERLPAVEACFGHGHEYRLLASEWRTISAAEIHAAYQFLRERLASNWEGRSQTITDGWVWRLSYGGTGTAMLRPESVRTTISPWNSGELSEACDALIEMAGTRQASEERTRQLESSPVRVVDGVCCRPMPKPAGVTLLLRAGKRERRAMSLRAQREGAFAAVQRIIAEARQSRSSADFLPSAAVNYR